MSEVTKEEIQKILSGYDEDNLTIGVACSHTALQLILGARREGFKTLGITLRERKETYESFPLARPDEFLVVDDFAEILEEENQERMIEKNTIVIPHGSFVEYVGPRNLMERFRVPMFGNRASLEWESNREKQREWLRRAGLKLPKVYGSPSEIDGKVFVKFRGAKGGRGFFTASSEEEFHEKLEGKVRSGAISEAEAREVTIQEFVSGVRYYPHYFYTPVKVHGARAGEGSVELLGMDKRIEPIDEIYRGLPDVPDEFFDYTVTGNAPVVVREKLLVDVMRMAVNVVNASLELFPPGMVGPFCLETIYHPARGFTVFEISGRIVAGTNLYPEGSPYSPYFYEEPMSTGRRIAREIKECAKRGLLDKVIY